MTNLPSFDALKAQAKLLRQSLVDTGHSVGHAQSLEIVAKQHGFRDWNIMHAKAGNAAQTLVQLGQILAGFYMGKPFKGPVIRAHDLAHAGRVKITVRFDAPVNVSKFASMVVERRQVTANIGPDGQKLGLTGKNWKKHPMARPTFA